MSLKSNASSGQLDTSSDVLFKEPRKKLRILITKTPFYCSDLNENCQLKANGNKQELEDELLDDGVALVIS